MIVVVYDLDLVEKLRVEHNDKPNALSMMVDEVHDLMTHLVELLVVVVSPFG